MGACRYLLHWVVSAVLFWILCLSGLHKWTWTVGSLELSEDLYRKMDVQYRQQIAPEWEKRTGHHFDPVSFKQTFGGGELCGGLLLLTPWWRLGAYLTVIVLVAAILTQVWLHEEGLAFPLILLSTTFFLFLLAEKKKVVIKIPKNKAAKSS